MSSPCLSMSFPLLTHALPFSRSLPATCDRYFRTLLISRFLCLLPGKGAFESPFGGIPLLPDSQWPLDSRVSTSSSEARGTLHVAARLSIRPRASGGRPWPCSAGPMRSGWDAAQRPGSEPAGPAALVSQASPLPQRIPERNRPPRHLAT